MSYMYRYTKIGFMFCFVLTISLNYGQHKIVENCSGLTTEQTLINQDKNLSITKEELPVNKYEKSIVVESTKGSSKTILITDKDLQEKMSNKEFRDQITAIFGVESVQVSLQEPFVRITILSEYVKNCFVNHLGYSETELKKSNILKL